MSSLVLQKSLGKSLPSNSPKIENNSDFTMEMLEDEPGYYQYVIRPLLHPGHEEELYTWLKEMGLMKKYVTCHNAQKSPICNIPMKWKKAKIIDKYRWKCNECSRKRPIRDDSFFKQSRCSLVTSIRIILGWCKDIPSQDLSKALNIKENMIKLLYEACGQIAEGYVRTHKQIWKFGNNDNVVIIDLYPDGCAKASNLNPNYQNNNPNKILCIAEVKTFPTNYWFHAITSTTDEEIKEEALNVIKNMVKPGTTIIADSNAKICFYNDLLSCNDYSNIVSIKDLQVFDKPNCTVLENLETIWREALQICEEAQNYPQFQVQFYLYNMIWRRKFGVNPSSAMETILHHIADHYPINY